MMHDHVVLTLGYEGATIHIESAYGTNHILQVIQSIKDASCVSVKDLESNVECLKDELMDAEEAAIYWENEAERFQEELAEQEEMYEALSCSCAVLREKYETAMLMNEELRSLIREEE